MFALLAVLFAATPVSADFETVRILYTADLHSRTRPTPDFAAPGLPRRELGGWASLQRLVDSLRTPSTLVLDGGDFAFGAPESDSSQGRVAVRFLTGLGCAASVAGARDFSGGAENLEVLARAAGFPLLADPMLDVVLRRQAPLFRRPYRIVTVEGIKVAVVGITDPETPQLNTLDDTRGLPVDPTAVELAHYLAAVRAESADIVVVLGHISAETGTRIADSFPEADLVLCRAEPGADGNRLAGRRATPVVSSGAYGQRLAVVDLLFHKIERKLYQSEVKVLNVAPAAADTEPAWLKEVRQPGWDSAAAVGRTELGADSAGRLGIALLGAEAVRRKSGADIAVLPLSVVEPGLAAGPLSRYDLFSVLPFRERLRVVVADDTTLARLVSPESVDPTMPAPAIAGADYFVAGDTTQWPQVVQVVRARVRDRRGPTANVVTTEAWLERAGIRSAGRLLPFDLTSAWLQSFKAGETVPPVPAVRFYPATPGLVRAAAPGLVNINTADAELLCALPGIGPATAQRIIEYRQTVGRFATVDELDRVKGIGPKKMEQLRPLVTVR